MSEMYKDMLASVKRLEKLCRMAHVRNMTPRAKLAALNVLKKRAEKGEDVREELKELTEPHDYGKDLSDNDTYYDKSHGGTMDEIKVSRSKKAEGPAHNYGPNLDDIDVYYDRDHDGVLDQPFDRQASKKKVAGPDLEKIHVEYGVVENRRGKDYGWLPVIWGNGRQYGSTFATNGYDRDVAMQLAKEEAEEFLSRYTGDWDRKISPRK